MTTPSPYAPVILPFDARDQIERALLGRTNIGGASAVMSLLMQWPCAPAPSSTEDTPAAHTHTDACMCVMVPMDVVGAYECNHCGGHDGGPCGSLCEVAYDEITATPAAPEPRVWHKGDKAMWRGLQVEVIEQHPKAHSIRLPEGWINVAFPGDLTEVSTPTTGGQP